VVATLALFVALGGSAVAAGMLTGKNIKNNSLTGKDVKNNSLTGKDVKGLGTGDFKKSELSKLTGKTGPMGLRGLTGPPGPGARQVHYRAAGGTAAQQLFSLSGMTVTAECTGGGDDFVTLHVTTDTNNSILGVSPLVQDGNGGGLVTNPGVDDQFKVGETQTITIDDSAATMAYGRGPDSTPVVTASFLANYHVPTNECKVVGTVVGG
jgi:hypothetical protein